LSPVAGTRDRGSPVVELRNVSKTYLAASGSEVAALKDVSLQVEPQAFISLIGPSGCGKSTLLRIIAGLMDASAGTVLVNGQTPAEARLARAYGMVFQTPTLFEWRSVRANVELPLEISGIPRRERQGIAEDALRLVGLGEYAESRVWELSGGMQQRVAIARALGFRPALLLMDEPFGALDEMTRERMNLELLRIRAETGTTVVFVTHSIAEAVFMSTRVLVLSPRPGRITAEVEVDLAVDRSADTRQEPHFFELVNEIRANLGFARSIPAVERG
jgi:NitT/TauT family transport system ATP-binding protein